MTITVFRVMYCDGAEDCTWHQEPAHGEPNQTANDIFAAMSPKWFRVGKKHYCNDCWHRGFGMWGLL